MVEGVSKALWIAVATVFAAAASFAPVVRGRKASCYFVFGDSLFDNGSNNDLDTSAQVNNLPYGIDFPQGPTGRFSNGRNIADFIAELAGLNNTIPPSREALGERANFGMNYASRGGKIDYRRSLESVWYIKYIYKHHLLIREAALPRSELSQCLYIFSFGNYDYLNLFRYRIPDRVRRVLDHLDDKFAKALIFEYKHTFEGKELMYKLGARNVALFGIGRIGCTPRMISFFDPVGGRCIEKLNKGVEFFNKELQNMVADLNKQLSGAKFTYVDLFSGYAKAVDTAPDMVGDRSCCTVKPLEGLCAVNGTVCPDRTKYLFWDDLHTTETINAAVANLAFNGSITSPFSISQLVNGWPF